MADKTDGVPGKRPWDGSRDMLAVCEKRLKEHPEDLEGIIKIAESLWQMGKRGSALEFLKSALTYHPGDPTLRGLIQSYSGENPVESPERLPRWHHAGEG
ncbi:MAG: hypothetical protein WC728_07125 [Elusimicrobiota bacterium]